MKRAMTASLLALGFMFAVGCGGGSSGSGSGTSGETTAGDVISAGPKSWEVIEGGSRANFDQMQETYVVVRDNDTWRFLYAWAKGSGQTAIPTVDFKKEIVAAAFLEEAKPAGRAVNFTEVEFNNPDATATVDEYFSDTPPLSIEITERPYQFIRLSKIQGQLFIKKEPDLPFVSQEMTFEDLFDLDWINQWDAQQASGQPFSQPTAEEVNSLSNGVCPIGGTELLFSQLWADGSSFNISNEGYWCPEHQNYWVLHEQVGFVGTVTYWIGGFSAGVYP